MSKKADQDYEKLTLRLMIMTKKLDELEATFHLTLEATILSLQEEGWKVTRDSRARLIQFEKGTHIYMLDAREWLGRRD